MAAIPPHDAPDDMHEHFRDGTKKAVQREWVGEVPVALEFNGLAYAVMMATPDDLEDFVRGFALTEGLADSVEAITAIDVVHTDKGVIARAQLSGLGIAQLQERVRMRVSESSCGLCGVENLEALAEPLPPVPQHKPLDADAIFHALGALPEWQVLGRKTGSAHGAAFCNMDGEIIMVREDVGRHNALDKLIGGLAQRGLSHSGQDMSAGFVLSTARCSYEIVEKTVRAGGCRLVTISLPTSMAVGRARAAGLSLYCLARDNSFLDLSA